MNYLRYRDDIEQVSDDESEVIDKIIAAMTEESARTEKKLGHAVRVSHAKATGFLVGELHVAEDIPAELRQGLFERPGRYTALVRVAQGPGEMVHDRVSTHRGIAIKIIGIDGDKIADDDERQTQDFVLEAGKTFPNADAASFLQSIKGLAKAPLLPDAVKNVVSSTARAANAVLGAVGLESRKLDFFGHPSLHPLSESYFSQVPLRFGDYVAKLGVYPATPAQQRLSKTEIDASDEANAFRDAVVDFCRSHPAEFEVRVQLAMDSETMPIEDGTVEWPEEESPYRTVARLVLPPQNAYSEERRAYFDETLTFRPAHSLVAHRPLGSIMRARLKVYAEMSRLRQQRNGGVRSEPRSAADIPA